jgi:hypothetical protein
MSRPDHTSSEPVVPGDRALIIDCPIPQYLWQEVYVESFFEGPALTYDKLKVVSVVGHVMVTAPWLPPVKNGYAMRRCDLLKISPDEDTEDMEKGTSYVDQLTKCKESCK